jgi:hypothetical protein
MNDDYWETSLSELLDDMKLSLTAEQKDELIGGIMGIAENESLACGYDCIPNPMQSEVSELKRQIREMEEKHDRQIWGIKKGVGQRRRVPPQDVHVDEDGNVEYDTVHQW